MAPHESRARRWLMLQVLSIDQRLALSSSFSSSMPRMVSSASIRSSLVPNRGRSDTTKARTRCFAHPRPVAHIGKSPGLSVTRWRNPLGVFTLPRMSSHLDGFFAVSVPRILGNSQQDSNRTLTNFITVFGPLISCWDSVAHSACVVHQVGRQ